MKLDEMKQAADRGEQPPAGMAAPLRALWLDRQGAWDAAHRIVQAEEGRDAAWVHAYLHRKEGDLSNARYWFHRAGLREPSGSLEAEWEQIAGQLLETR